jgi:hypothetical protein
MGLGKWLEKNLWEPLIEKPVKWVKEEIVEPIVKTVKNTVTAILKDPLPFIAQIAGSFVGIPPYVTSAAITAMRGGDFSDIAKSAAVAYIGSKAFSSTSYGQSFGEAGATVNDFTSQLATDYGLSTTTATILGNAAQSGFTTATLSGVRALITGKDVGDAIVNGFTQGSVYGASDSYFSDINTQKDWGITANTAKQLSGLTASVGNAVLTGRDPEKAIANYITYATTQTLNSELKKGASNLWEQAKTFANATTDAKKNYDEKQSQYDSTTTELQAVVDAFNAEREKINAQRDPYVTAYNTNLGEYNKQKAIYDDASNGVVARNLAADQMEKYAAEMQKAVDGANSFNSQLEELNAMANEINTIKQTLTDPSVGIAKELKDAADAVESNYNNYNKTIEEAKLADDEYGKQVAEVATREALVDAVNSGTLKTIENPDAPEGSITLENGLVITADGKYLQDGKEIFTTASGVDQSKLDFKTEDGSHYIFGSDGQRLTSETDAAKLAENNFGIKLDEKEAAKFADVPYGTLDPLKEVAEKKIEDQLKDYGYKAPSQEMVDSFIQKGGDTLGFVEQFIDPYHVAADEVNEYYKSVLGREATPEEIELHVGAKAEADVFNERQAQELERMRILQEVFGQSSSPIYAETSKGLDIVLPKGYSLASIEDVKNKDKTGAIYDPGVNAWLMPAPSLSPVNVTSQNESYLQDFFGDYYKSPVDNKLNYDYIDADGVHHVVASPEEDPTWEAGFPVNEDPSLDTVTVTAKREEEPLLDLPFSPLTPQPPVANVTVPKTVTPTTPKAPAPTKAPTTYDALIAAMMGSPTVSTADQTTPEVPVVQQSRMFDMSQPLDIGFFDQPIGSQNTNKEEPGVVKIASGGYMDILFPKQGMSMDEILRILEGTHHG